MHEFENDETMTGIAFIDINFFCTSLQCVQNFIVAGDFAKSIWFCAFQEEPPKIIMLGKDYYHLHTTACEFLIDDNLLCMFAADNERNAHLFSYAPYS